MIPARELDELGRSIGIAVSSMHSRAATFENRRSIGRDRTVVRVDGTARKTVAPGANTSSGFGGRKHLEIGPVQSATSRTGTIAHQDHGGSVADGVTVSWRKSARRPSREDPNHGGQVRATLGRRSARLR